MAIEQQTVEGGGGRDQAQAPVELPWAILRKHSLLACVRVHEDGDGALLWLSSLSRCFSASPELTDWAAEAQQLIELTRRSGLRHGKSAGWWPMGRPAVFSWTSAVSQPRGNRRPAVQSPRSVSPQLVPQLQQPRPTRQGLELSPLLHGQHQGALLLRIKLDARHPGLAPVKAPLGPGVEHPEVRVTEAKALGQQVAFPVIAQTVDVDDRARPRLPEPLALGTL